MIFSFVLSFFSEPRAHAAPVNNQSMKPATRFKPYILNTKPYIGGSTRSENGQEKMFKLSSNENLLGPSPKALKAIKDNLGLLHEYNFQDDSKFRDALACAFDYEMNARQFIVANSGMELLDLICRAFLEPGEECILSTPTFLAYKSFTGLSGGVTRDVPLHKKSFALNIDGIVEAVGEKTKIIFISSPNNPTGSIVQKKDMEVLLKSIPDHVTIVYDEVYHHYVDHPGYARALDFIKEEYPVIGLHSFSKAYGLAGIRLGYAFATEEIAGYLNRLRRPFMVGTLAMEAGIAALGDHEHLQKTVELVEKEKSWLYLQLKKYGIKYWPGHANFILLHPPYEAHQFAADLLASGVMVRTGDPFGAPELIRLTVGTHEANQAFINGLKKHARVAGPC